jgi:TetR/AcrR family transcriptional regulator
MPAPPRTPRPAPKRRRTAATPDSQDRILHAALAEFASRGFAGARVDRIAAAARINKAMLYYHFGSKARLYRATIQHLLGHLAARLEDIAASNAPPSQKLDTYIETFIRLGLQQPQFAPIMLREVAEGAARIDQDTAQYLLRIVGTMATIVGEGHAAGVFRDVNPLLAYLTTVWPIMVYVASASARQIIAKHSPYDTTGFQPDAFIRHMQETSRRALAAEPVTGIDARAAGPDTEHHS